MVKQRGFLDCNELWRMEWRGLVWIAAVFDMILSFAFFSYNFGIGKALGFLLLPRAFDLVIQFFFNLFYLFDLLLFLLF